MTVLSSIITPTNIITAASTTTLTNKTIGVTQLSGAVAVSNGGTGATTLTANNVVLGNGTSAVQFKAPGTSGNVLTSDGVTWNSVANSGLTTGKAIAMAIVFGG